MAKTKKEILIAMHKTLIKLDIPYADGVTKGDVINFIGLSLEQLAQKDTNKKERREKAKEERKERNASLKRAVYRVLTKEFQTMGQIFPQIDKEEFPDVTESAVRLRLKELIEEKKVYKRVIVYENKRRVGYTLGRDPKSIKNIKPISPR